MKRLFSALIVLAMSLTAPNTLALSKLTIPAGKRTLYVTGPIDGSVLSTASTLERLSVSSDEDIHIVINSPGGVVYAGYQLVQAMDIARQRGVKVVCTVGVMAASMAFQLLPHCSERYAMKNTLLLFHPSRVYVRGPLTADEAKMVAESLDKIDTAGLKETEEMIAPPSKAWLKRHHDAETLWRAEDLVAETNNDWITIVDDISAPGGIFNIGFSGREEKDKAIKKELDESRWIIVN